MYGNADHWIRLPAWSFLLVFYRNHSPEVRRFLIQGTTGNSVYSRHLFLGGGDSTPKLTISSPPNGCQTVGSKSFFRPGQWSTNISRKLLFQLTVAVMLNASYNRLGAGSTRNTALPVCPAGQSKQATWPSRSWTQLLPTGHGHGRQSSTVPSVGDP